MHIETVGSTEPSPLATALNPQRRFLLEHIGFDKTIVRAEGHHLIDAQGNRYLDALAQYGAVPFGHNPTFIWDALLQLRATSQPGFVQPLLNTGSETLARKLVEMLPGMARVCLVSTGAEATEVAIKLARARTGRRKILSVERGFHGKTNAALCATANLSYRAPFLVDAEQFSTLPFGDLPALETALQSQEVAAFIIEPVQGEGGMRLQPAGYLLAAQVLCKRYGTLLIIDEVQCGLGRTGTLFGFQQHGEVRPDVVLLAKALGGGMVPLGAVVCTEAAWSDAFGMLHSSTFANSHLTATVGLATLQALQADGGALLEQIQRRGALLRAGLEQLAQRYPTVIAAIHGQGLMQGIELRPWSGTTSYFNAHASQSGYAVPIVAGYLLNQQGVLTAPTFNTSNVLRVQPALTISDAEIAKILRALDAAMALIATEDFATLFSSMVPALPRAAHAAAPRRAKLRPRVHTPTPSAARRFAFLVHPTDDDAQFETLPASVKQQGAAVREPWLRWIRSWGARLPQAAPVFHVPSVQSPSGAIAEGWLIATSLTPTQMIKLGAAAREQLLQSYIQQARNVGAEVVGLGAFTSVISQGGLNITDCGLNLTTGNSLTALASAESLLHHAVRQQRLQQETFAVVGAAGSVGRLAALHLAQHGARRLNLVGNANNQRASTALRAVGGEILLHVLEHGAAQCQMAQVLRRTALLRTRWLTQAPNGEAEYALAYEELSAQCRSQGIECPIAITTDLAAGLRQARYVLTATSAGRTFITPETFMQGAVVCDVARPLDVGKRVAQARSDLLIYEGGLMRLPHGLRFGATNVLGYPDSVNLACLSESMVLALEGVSGHHSLGNRIDYSQALHIRQLARKHGFEPLLEPLSTQATPATTPRRAVAP